MCEHDFADFSLYRANNDETILVNFVACFSCGKLYEEIGHLNNLSSFLDEETLSESPIG